MEPDQTTDGARSPEGTLFKDIFDTLPFMLSVLDGSGHVVLVNRHWEQTLGWTLDELVTGNLDIYAETCPNDEDRRRAHELVAAATGEWQDFRVRIKSGRTLDTAWAVVRLTPGVYVGIGQNVADGRRVDVSVREALQQTESVRGLAAHLHAVREEERARIAREIHDELGQVLTSLKMEVALLRDPARKRAGPEARARDERALQRMGGLIDRSIQAVRKIATELRPLALDKLGLAAAIEWQADELLKTTGIRCDVSLPRRDVPRDGEAATALFRILQESLTNIARHARATRVSVRLWNEAHDTVLQVHDNGIGIPREAIVSPESFGLLSMKERAVTVGGRLEVVTSPRAGTTITARVPHAARPFRTA